MGINIFNALSFAIVITPYDELCVFLTQPAVNIAVNKIDI